MIQRVEILASGFGVWDLWSKDSGASCQDAGLKARSPKTS